MWWQSPARGALSSTFGCPPRSIDPLRPGPATRLSLIAGCLGFALLDGVLIRQRAVLDLDVAVVSGLHVAAVSWLTEVVTGVTALGGTIAVVGITTILSAYLVLRRRFGDVLFLLGAVVGAQILTTGLKLTVARHRPAFDDPLAIGTGFSFPSGHALSSTALYGAIALIAAADVGTPARRRVFFLVAAALVGLIGFSRLYLGVHYLSDVLAGFAIGVAWLSGLALVRRYLERRTADERRRTPR